MYAIRSYYDEDTDIIGETEYGYRFTSAVAHGNVLGIQPHPEKSSYNFV